MNEKNKIILKSLRTRTNDYLLNKKKIDATLDQLNLKVAYDGDKVIEEYSAQNYIMISHKEKDIKLVISTGRDRKSRLYQYGDDSSWKGSGAEIKNIRKVNLYNMFFKERFITIEEKQELMWKETKVQQLKDINWKIANAESSVIDHKIKSKHYKGMAESSKETLLKYKEQKNELLNA